MLACVGLKQLRSRETAAIAPAEAAIELPIFLQNGLILLVGETRDALRMEHNQTTNFRNSAAQVFLGGIALAFVTLAFLWLHVDLASAALANSLAQSGSLPRTRTGCSTRSSPPDPAAWAWDSRSAVRSWKLTGDVCQLPAMLVRVRHFNSSCLCIRRIRRDRAS